MQKTKITIAALLLLAFVVFVNSGCTLNFVVDIESASGRDGGISEQATDTEETTPTVDMTADVNGV